MYCRLHQLVGMLPLFRIIHWRKSTKISDCIPFAVTIFLLRFQLFYSARGQEEPNAYSSPKKEFLQSSRCHGSAILQFLVGNLTRFGRCPVKLLLARFKTCKFRNCLQQVGSFPENLLSDRSSLCL